MNSDTTPVQASVLLPLPLPCAFQTVGRVERQTGLIIESQGPHARQGDICHIRLPHQPEPLVAEVVGFREGRLLMMPLGDAQALSPGCVVRNTHAPLQVSVGPTLKGRVLDALGRPLDDRHALVGCTTQYPAMTTPPHPLKREPIRTILPVGVRAIDGFLTLGEGQRVGLFAGSGVGKSTLLGMIARNAAVDVNVIALIGERGREVREFMDEALGQEGLRRSVVVVATAEQPALLKIRASLVATAIAEYYRDQGQRVMLMMDSLTRVALALREVGLSLGEPPTTRGYTPSVFAYMPKLLERAGTSKVGSITGLYTVLVEGDDMNEPVADLVRGLLDGHIVLSRALAHKGHYPAIDLNASVSRLFLQLAQESHQQAARFLREQWAVYHQSEDLISVGAYVAGANRVLDQAVHLKPAIEDLLKQPHDTREAFDDTLAAMGQLAGLPHTPRS